MQCGYSGTNCQVADACTASTVASKDGSDGTFYCINGGTVGGTTGACTHRVRRRIRGRELPNHWSMHGLYSSKQRWVRRHLLLHQRRNRHAPPDRARAQGATQDTAERAVRLPPRAPLLQTQLRMAVTVHFTASTVVLSADSLVTARTQDAGYEGVSCQTVITPSANTTLPPPPQSPASPPPPTPPSKKLVLDEDDHAAGLTGILVTLVATTLNML